MTDGFLVIDKPGGITSHDVVAKIRKRFKTKRVGHAGTLDPMATGVLVVGIGNATKLLQYIVEGRKSYDATISFGSSTHTDDKRVTSSLQLLRKRLTLFQMKQSKEYLTHLLAKLCNDHLLSRPSKSMV